MKSFVYQYGYAGSNCYLLTDDSQRCGIIIDPSAPPDLILPQYPAELAITHILLTHAHFDHLFYYEDWKNATGALSAIHVSENSALSDPSCNLSFLLRDSRKYPAADILLSEGDTISLGSEILSVLSTPGHTLGSVCYSIGNLLYSGDTIFADGGVGRTDFPTGDCLALQKSIDRLMDLPSYTIVFPGHGPSSTIAQERSYHS